MDENNIAVKHYEVSRVGGELSLFLSIADGANAITLYWKIDESKPTSIYLRPYVDAGGYAR